MNNRERTWVILLTGDGAGSATMDRQMLLEMTLSRSRSIVPREQIVVVIDRARKHFWSESLAILPGANVIVQPNHAGSAVEALLAILTILARDPLARIMVMPSHHYVSNETALASSLLDAAIPTAQTRNSLALIGIKPECTDTELNHIVPGRWFEDGTRSVLRMVKPSGKFLARELMARGALWDSSIVASRGSVLLGILRARVPDLVDQMETALAQGDAANARQRALTRLYVRLPSVDLSHILAQGAEAVCRVITSRSCGWSNPASAQPTITAECSSGGRTAATV